MREPEETKQVAIRLTLDVINRIDEFSVRHSPTGVKLSRSDAIRMILELGMSIGDREGKVEL